MAGQVAVLAAAEKGSFEAAGKYLGIGKSAVRKRVHSFEHELHTSIFHADGKRMVLTEVGVLYLGSARESVGQEAYSSSLKRVGAKQRTIQYATCLQIGGEAITNLDCWQSTTK